MYLGEVILDTKTPTPPSGDKLKFFLFNFAGYRATNLICLREL
jgi:hypothetical protein